MNYLAHLFLAEDTAESLIGNLLGNFVKRSLESHKERYSEDILKRIETHRKADSFTDTHCIFRRSKQRLSKIHLQQTLVTLTLPTRDARDSYINVKTCSTRFKPS
jgi:acyl carrier protein phosphodiesterase